MVLQIVFHTEFSLLPRGLGHSADSNNIPKNQTTIFQPILIVAILLKYRISIFVRLFQRCHLSLIDEVLKFGDSTLDLHKIFQIPMSCPYELLLVCVTARGTLTNSFPSIVKSLFCTERIESIEWQDLEQRQRTGDCSVIDHPR